MNPNPGPINPTVLTLQREHRSEKIWTGGKYNHIRFRKGVPLPNPIDERIVQQLKNAGFYGVYKLGKIKRDHALLEALVERWRIETHTFHFPPGEMTMTLEDMAMLSGLPIDGQAVTGEKASMSARKWIPYIQQLLGYTPNEEDMKGSTINSKSIISQFNNFEKVPEEASQEEIHKYARAYILLLLGSYVMTSSCDNMVNLMYLPLLADFSQISQYSWGSAALAYLYSSLCDATKPTSKVCCGYLTVLQIWAWERLLCVQPIRTMGDDIYQQNDDLPLSCRWKPPISYVTVTSHNLIGYRDQLSLLTDDQIVWQPYLSNNIPYYCVQGGVGIFMAKVPLICFDKVEWHHPDRVKRQFGMLQDVPNPCDPMVDLHNMNKRGMTGANYMEMHREYIEMWNARYESIIYGEFGQIVMTYDHPYMRWYNSITRLLIQNPTQIQNAGFRPVAGTFQSNRGMSPPQREMSPPPREMSPPRRQRRGSRNARNLIDEEDAQQEDREEVSMSSGSQDDAMNFAGSFVGLLTTPTSSFGQQSFHQGDFQQSSFPRSRFSQPSFPHSSFGEPSFPQSNFHPSSFPRRSFDQSSNPQSDFTTPLTVPGFSNSTTHIPMVQHEDPEFYELDNIPSSSRRRDRTLPRRTKRTIRPPHNYTPSEHP